MTTREKVEQLKGMVEQTQAAYAKAMELYEDEPTRAHEENYREAQSEYRLAKRSLAAYSDQYARETNTARPCALA